ncbi:replication initiation protein [Deinococcus detaillensis]|nr:replication initiation protein [Deinococcus detaillensis]
MYINKTQGTPQNPLDLFIDRLAIKPMCSDDPKRFGTHQEFRHIALKRRMIQPNNPYERQCIVIDHDSSEAGAAWIDAGAPPPNFMMVNPVNGHAHYTYLLDKPVMIWGEGFRGRKTPWDFYQDIAARLTAMLGGDTRYNQNLVKNPLHSDWCTRTLRTNPYSLTELAELLPGIEVIKPQVVHGEGRNQTLFDNLRKWAYLAAPTARKQNSPTWQLDVEQKAYALNGFDEPLPTNEVKSVAKSVAWYAWENAYRFAASALGGMKRSKVQREDREEMSKEEAYQRMADGGRLGAERNQERVRSLISKAVFALSNTANRLTQQVIATFAGVSLSSVKRHRDLMTSANLQSTTTTEVHPDLTLFETSSGSESPSLPISERICIAAQILRETSSPSTQKWIAAVANCCVRTVQRHRQALNEDAYHHLTRPDVPTLRLARPNAA